MTTLTKEKVQAISQLYSASEAFRKNIDMAILTEANLASNMAKLLSAAVDGSVDPTPVKAPGKKRGPKPGSKRKASKKTAKKAPEASTEVSTRVTHRDAILKVLASGGKMTKGDIETGLKTITDYDVPSPQTLSTTLHGMKKDGLIVGSGKRPNLQYATK